MNKIDFVIAWVNGNDESHKLKRRKYQNEFEATDATSDTRFASDDEIYFSIASILKYVPYSGTIYIVTDQQVPAYLDEFVQQGICDSNKIKVIDHQELFDGYQQYLPTFNSLTIETMLWNIPNLSAHFIYLNDDFFFNSDSEQQDFFQNDKIKIYGHWKTSFFIHLKCKIRQCISQYTGKKLQPKYSVAQMLSASVLGGFKYFEIHHRPHIVDKIILKNYFQEHEHILQSQIQFRFRSIEQFLPVGLNNHLKIKANQADLINDVEIAYLKNSNSLKDFKDALKNQSIKFGCVQSLDRMKNFEANSVRLSMIAKFREFLPKSVMRTDESKTDLI